MTKKQTQSLSYQVSYQWEVFGNTLRYVIFLLILWEYSPRRQSTCLVEYTLFGFFSILFLWKVVRLICKYFGPGLNLPSPSCSAAHVLWFSCYGHWTSSPSSFHSKLFTRNGMNIGRWWCRSRGSFMVGGLWRLLVCLVPLICFIWLV